MVIWNSYGTLIFDVILMVLRYWHFLLGSSWEWTVTLTVLEVRQVRHVDWNEPCFDCTDWSHMFWGSFDNGAGIVTKHRGVTVLFDYPGRAYP